MKTAKMHLYGLVDGSLMLYVELRNILVALGVAVSVHDESFFFVQKNDKLYGIIVIPHASLVPSTFKLKFKHSMEVDTSFSFE